jgi:hypothetical protein
MFNKSLCSCWCKRYWLLRFTLWLCLQSARPQTEIFSFRGHLAIDTVYRTLLKVTQMWRSHEPGTLYVQWSRCLRGIYVPNTVLESKIPWSQNYTWKSFKSPVCVCVICYDIDDMIWYLLTAIGLARGDSDQRTCTQIEKDYILHK